MKKIIIFLVFTFYCIIGFSQTYQPGSHIVINDAMGPGNATPLDGRSMFYDVNFFLYRDFNGPTEVLTYLNLAKYRTGHFPIYVHLGGSLSGGIWTGGQTLVYFFRNGVADSNLVRWYTDSTSGGGGITQLNGDVIAGPGSGNVSASLATVTSNTGSFGNAANVAQISFDGKGRQLTAANIPIQIAEAQVTNLTSDLASKLSNITGLLTTGAGYTLSGSGTTGSPYSLNISFPTFNQDSIKHFFVDTGASARNLYRIAWDSVNRKWILSAPASGGGGSGTVTNFIFTNGNGFTGTVGTSTTTPTLSLAPSFTGLTFSNGSAFAAATVSSPITYSAGTLGIQIANTSQSGAISNTDWNTFNTKQNAISLTTTGTTGAATFVSNILNIPQYQGQLTLTTTGNSGASTLIGNTINIPQYQGLLSNSGTGFRWFVPGSSIRSFVCAGCTLDSTSNAGSLTLTVTAGGSGTVTSFSAGTLSPLFTTSVATATTTPALSFTLSNAAANSVFGNNTGSSAAPAYFVPNATTLNGWFGGTIQSAISLTTTGTSGAATFAANTLNIPQYQGALTLTTTGTSGAATLIGNTLNVPQYSTGGGGSTLTFGNGLIAGTYNGSAPVTVQADTAKFGSFTYLGPLYVKNTWAGTGDFTVTGATVTNPSGKIGISGGNQSPSHTVGTNNTAFNQYAKITAYQYGNTMLERHDTYDTIVINTTPSSSTTGIGVGVIGTSASGANNLIAWFDASTNAGAGTVTILSGANNTTVAVSPTALAFSVGDSIILRLHRVEDRVTATAWNVHTKSTLVQCSYQWDQSNASNVLSPNTGVWGIVEFGGSFTLNSINVSSSEAVNADILLAGDSKFAGYSTPWSHRIGSLLNRFYAGTIVSSGEGDRTADLINHLPEIIALKPKTVILCIGRNDIANAVPTATWEANLDTIADRLNRAGITYYSLDAIYETTVSQTNLINFLDTAIRYGGHSPSLLIQSYAAGNFTGSTGLTDGIHPSYLGAEAVVDAIRGYMMVTNNGRYLNTKNPEVKTTPGYDSMWLMGTLNMNRLNTANSFYAPTTARQQGDIVMAAGTGITAAYGIGTQANRIVLSNAGNAQMEFRAFTGGLPSNGIISFYTAGATTGNQSLALQITEGGTILLGGVSNTTVSLKLGDLIIPANSALKSGTSNDGKHENQIILDTTTNGNMMFRVIDSAGAFVWFQSLSTPGSQTQTMTLDKLGNLLLNTTADSSSFLDIAAGTATTAQIFLGASATLNTAAIKNGMLQYIKSGGADSLNFYHNGTVTNLLAASGGGTLTYTQNATNNNLAISGGNNVNFLTATTSLAGLLDTARAKYIDSARQRLITFNINVANGLHAPTTDSIVLGGTLNQVTTISQAGNGLTISGSKVTFGALAATRQWAPGAGITGDIFGIIPATLNDSATAASSTLSPIAAVSITQPTFSATNTGITYTDAYNLLINGTPVASTNITITNPYAFGVIGTSKFTGTVNISGSTTSAYAVKMISGTDPTTTLAGGLTWNGTNLNFGDAGNAKRDLLNGIHNYVHSIFTPTTGGTVNLTANNYNIINPAGTIATLTVNLPSSPVNNDLVYIKYTQSVTAVTYANGTVVDGITAPTAGGLVTLVYDQSSNSWY